MSLFTHRATLRYRGEPAGVDRDGNPIVGPPREVVSPAWWEVRSTTEDGDGKTLVIDGYWLYLPESTRLTALDSVDLPGLGVFEVDGEPGIQPGGFVVPGCVMAPLRRARG